MTLEPSPVGRDGEAAVDRDGRSGVVERAAVEHEAGGIGGGTPDPAGGAAIGEHGHRERAAGDPRDAGEGTRPARERERAGARLRESDDAWRREHAVGDRARERRAPRVPADHVRDSPGIIRGTLKFRAGTAGQGTHLHRGRKGGANRSGADAEVELGRAAACGG